ncbi:MAG: CopG family ribbon-helix-helix protein [Patescibacteria group bacterium]
MKTQLINFVIPEKLLREVDALAKKLSKSRSEVLRESARLLVEKQKQRKGDFAAIRKSAKVINIKEEDAYEFVDKIRNSLPMNK